MDKLVEFIDIGGPTMIRAAAKNHTHVAVISDPSDYEEFVTEWQTDGGIGLLPGDAWRERFLH